MAVPLFPEAPAKYGAFPSLLVVLTMVTGLVDAVSFLGLGRVFVANMTGNVVFVGFALAGDRELSAWASLLAVVSFAAGAAGAGWLVRRAATRGGCSPARSRPTRRWWRVRSR